MKRFLKKLNEPFPDFDSPRENLRNTILIGAFITFFLYFFSPEGVDKYPYNKFLMCVNFGLITIFVSIIFEWIVEKVFKLNRSSPYWTLKRWILYVFLLLICISIGNYIYYAYLFNSDYLNLQAFFFITLNTIAIGLFPVVFSGLLIQMRANNRNQIQAEQLQSHFPKKLLPTEIIKLNSTQKNQNFEAPANEIFYLEAMQNYVSICFQKEGKVKKEMLRNTIGDMESQLENTTLIRCHRSFIVNSDLINNVSGNAQGLRLELKNLEEIEVPVSRKYIHILKEIIS